MSFESDKRTEALDAGLSFACYECGGNWKSDARYIPHATDCSRYAGLRRDQDIEGEALRDLRAPFPLRDPIHPFDCPCGCGDRDDARGLL